MGITKPFIFYFFYYYWADSDSNYAQGKGEEREDYKGKITRGNQVNLPGGIKM